MKIAITGHTSGIGKGLYDYFCAQGDEVIGYSRSTGWDLSKISAPQMSAAIDNDGVDTVILNAHVHHSQVWLLHELSKCWKDDRSKTIVVISSLVADGLVKVQNKMYASEKAAMEMMVQMLHYESSIRIINIKPGAVDTPRMAYTQAIKKLRVEDVVNSVAWALLQPPDVYIRNITITPR